MATALNLDPAIVRSLDDLVRSGRFASREAAVSEGLRLVEIADWGEPVDLDDLSPSERAGVERGLADVAAGRVHTSAQVRAELERRRALRA